MDDPNDDPTLSGYIPRIGAKKPLGGSLREKLAYWLAAGTIFAGLSDLVFSLSYFTSEFGGFGLIIYQIIFFTPLLLIAPMLARAAASKSNPKNFPPVFWIAYLSLGISWGITVFRLNLFR